MFFAELGEALMEWDGSAGLDIFAGLADGFAGVCVGDGVSPGFEGNPGRVHACGLQLVGETVRDLNG
ncbi:hypothetical protein [Bryocella elongata]|uniref:hypothetical protein n=1 Tax=Bryocella elongata TaxID=863522 RepID=UPI00135716CA|nr:hypothetical protein [Bryocella elongata]